MKNQKKIVILGVGNYLLKDEGIGIHVINHIKELELPSHIEVIDGGTIGIDIIYVIEDAYKLIVVDAVDAGCEPGTIFKFSPEEISERIKDNEVSLYQVGILEALVIARQRGKCPQTIIIGVQPKKVEWGMEPTNELNATIPKIVELVREETRAKIA